ncbi:ATP-dependent helicase [Aquiluna borgnonia]|uniref:DNA 3'-5' helicase n=1 Tax=Aquiluna borgnonia TaxID=2499157 RepID=A0A7D4Q4D4_9MICO|nr:ATP-dependent helicase [Aquiluna borgnonia]QKJ25529.1 ATP-dependent helicase [Aquiluna borgnonia]
MSQDSVGHPLLAGLDEQQREAAQALRGPVGILAGAGSGKTRTISHRIAYGIDRGVFAANRILALTYTNRAASELRSRLRSLGVTEVAVRTFHSAALGQLQFFWPQLTGGLPPKLLTNKLPALREVLGELRLELRDEELRELAAEIELVSYSLVSPGQYLERERGVIAGFSPERFVTVLEAYSNYKQQKRLADWEDVLTLTLGLLRSEDRMLEHVQQQYRFFTVDEYQDISPLQQALLETWLGEREDVCVVGDPRQAIYGFAGADAGFLTGFGSRYPNAEIFELNRNYRSTSEIVASANSVASTRNLEPVRGELTSPVVIEAASASAEAKRIASGIAKSLAEGWAPSDIAVLSRINSQLEPIERELGTLGISVQVRGAGRFFRIPEVQKAMLAIRALQISTQPQPLFMLLSEILSQLGWSSQESKSEKWRNLNWFMEIFDELGSPSLDEFVRELGERERSGDEPIREAITLATVHATKGLEWRAVYLCGLNQGWFPISHAKTEAQLAEERRLFYVAITRACDQLTMSYISDRERSSFLKLL